VVLFHIQYKTLNPNLLRKCVFVCVCVCPEREREGREREREERKAAGKCVLFH